jgi:hypothetical protein
LNLPGSDFVDLKGSVDDTIEEFRKKNAYTPEESGLEPDVFKEVGEHLASCSAS